MVTWGTCLPVFDGTDIEYYDILMLSMVLVLVARATVSSAWLGPFGPFFDRILNGDHLIAFICFANKVEFYRLANAVEVEPALEFGNGANRVV